MSSADKQAEYFRHLCDQYYNSIYVYCCKRLNNRYDIAYDCTQNTFLAAFQSIAELQTHENPGGWLFKTSKNSVHTAMREIKREKDMKRLDVLNFDVPSGVNIVTQIEDKEISITKIRNNIMGLLTEKERLLHELFYIKGCNTAETAHKLGITASVCRVRLYRLRKKIQRNIRKAIESEGRK